MIKKISIKNYKSIVDDEIELGRVNVFIGANGAGKSNILEAVAMFSAAKGFDLSIENLESKGVRITKPNLTFNSFLGKRQKNEISFEAIVEWEKERKIYSALSVENPEDIYSTWKDEITQKQVDNAVDNYLSPMIQFLPSFPGKNDVGVLLKKVLPDMGKSAQEHIVNHSEEVFLPENFQTLINNLVIAHFQIYTLSTPALRGITKTSRKQPLGLNGENLDILLSTFNEEEWQLLMDYSHFISWLEKPLIDEKDVLKFEGHRLGRSTSRLYFVDQFMRKNNNIFAAENANEGALYVLFYLALFISKKTPSFFAIDNIETALNPKICRALMKAISELAEIRDKQVLITTHNPAVLDGINLTEQRLFVVSRTDEGHTKTKRLQFKPGGNQQKRKLSEYWMRGDLGGIPNNFI